MQALTLFWPTDIRNNILTFDVDDRDEKEFNNFCKIIEPQPNITREESITFSASYDLVATSLEGEIKFDDSEESDVTDDDDAILNENQMTTHVPEYSPRPNEWKNSTCSKCIPCVMKLSYKYYFHTAAFTNL